MTSISPSGSGSAPGPWQEPVRGGHPAARHLALPGVDQLRAILIGDAPAPPMTRLTGTRIVDAAPGTATFELPLSPWLRGSDGRASGGLLTMPADAAMACAIMTGLPPHVGLTTTELTLRQVRAAPLEGRLLARAHVIYRDRPIALADVSLRDEAGTLIAHGSSTCFIVDGGSPQETTSAQTDGTSTHTDGSPDPWQRDALPWAPGDADPPPLERLTGLHAIRARDGKATYVLPATGWLCAPPPGRVQGGSRGDAGRGGHDRRGTDVDCARDGAPAGGAQAQLPAPPGRRRP